MTSRRDNLQGCAVAPGFPAIPVWGLLALVCLVAFAVYGNTLSMGLVWDDVRLIKEDSLVRSLLNLPLMFSTDVWYGSLNDVTPAPYYRPLFKASLALDYAIWGENPFGYHLTNALLHVAASLCCFLAAAKFLRSHGAAFFAALVFAVHPVHSEAVAWISARNESLCAIFMLLSFLCYLRFKDGSRVADLILSLGAFFLSLLAKEMSITLPALVLLHELSFGSGGFRTRLRLPLLFALAAVPYLLLRTMILEVATWGGPPLLERVYTSFGLLARYLRLLVFPADLKVFYDLPMQQSFLAVDVLAPLAVLLLVVAATIPAWRVDRRIFFCMCWILITLAPVSGIPGVLVPALMAERYLYIPSLGLAFLAGTGLLMAWKRMAQRSGAASWQRGVLLTGGLLVAVLAFASVQRNHAWDNDAVFKERWVHDAPGDAGGHTSLGVVYESQGRYDEAVREYSEALRIRPNNIEARTNLGVVYDKTGRFNEAEREYKAVLNLDPRFTETYYNLGMLYLGQNRFGEALQAFATVLTLNPRSGDAHNNIAMLYQRQGRMDEARQHLVEALRLDPENELYRRNFAQCMGRSKGP
ncbi:tetratricopeptide repeat protein [Geomonas paludis]|uniref:Tetratricopeptide repeat protein n=1 Tax=Geomonas paludis TaxID=2740185 RepID=A0ABY4LID7_9BACT|nr:tetratricopeptide repeat protein [Geomonas paludis]UPU36715.1 tetratricopeptide repeat protein [Geomonas paludis]